MISLLGVSHISPESLVKIKKTLNEIKPDCVAVELDPLRYESLKEAKGSLPPGILPKLLAFIQRSLGKMTGIFPGEEMLTAIKLARKEKLPIFLIDQNFEITLRDIQNIPIIEKIKLFFLLIVSVFKGEKVDIRKIPEEKLVKEVLAYVRKHFPNLYKILITKRNRVMGKNLKILSKRYKNILAVVGAGHVPGLKRVLKNEKVKII